MNILRCMYAFAVYCLLVVCLQTSAEGIIAGTLIATPHGLHTIEKLAPGDPIICYDVQSVRQQQTIAHISYHISNNIIQLVVNTQTLYVDGEQRFYLPLEKVWCKAYQLVPGHVLLATLSEEQADAACDRYCVIEDVQKVSGLYQVYDLTVPVYHNFCITRLGLLTHNAVAALAPLIATFGAKVIAFFGALAASTPVALTSAQATVAAVGTTVGIGASIIHDTVKVKRAAQALQQPPSKPLLAPKPQSSDLHKNIAAQTKNLSKQESVSVSKPTTKSLDADPKAQNLTSVKNLHKKQVLLHKNQHTQVRKTSSHQHRTGIPRKSYPEHVPMHTAEQKAVRSHRKSCGTAQCIPSSIPPKICSVAQAHTNQNLAPSCGVTLPAQPPTIQTPCHTKPADNTSVPCNPALTSKTPAESTLVFAVEKHIGEAKSFEEGIKKALEEVKPDITTGQRRTGKQHVTDGKLDGRVWHGGKVTIRVDYDPQKGNHININDNRENGIGNAYISVPGTEQDLARFLKHWNTSASIDAAINEFSQRILEASKEGKGDILAERGLEAMKKAKDLL